MWGKHLIKLNMDIDSARAVIDRKYRFVAALFAFVELLDKKSRSGKEVGMKKREFQKKATAELFKKLMEVCAELGENPNITVSSKYNSSYFKLRKNYNLIQISVKQTGELSYQLTDMLSSTDGKQIYYEYRENDDFKHVIEKFVDDFGRLYKDFLLSGTLHEFYCIRLSHDKDAGEELKEYESCINAGYL